MPEQNGSESAVRLDRIERILEQTVITLDRLAQTVEINHSYMERELKNLLRSQILMQDQMDKDRTESRARGKELDERIAGLVSAIGALIAKRG